MKKWIFFILFASISANSETENFNMALTGNILKDYCSLSLSGDSGSFDIYDKAFTSMYLLRYVTYELHCSSGDYSISIESGDVDNLDIGGNISLRQRVTYDLPRRLPITKHFSLGQPFGASVTFDEQYYRAIIDVSAYAIPIDGIFENMGDTYNHTFTNVITIESL